MSSINLCGDILKETPAGVVRQTDPDTLITFIREDGKVTRTQKMDSQGHYAVALEPGKYHVSVLASDGSCFDSDSWVPISDKVTRKFNCTLAKPRAASIYLHGQARPYGRGAGIADVDIDFINETNGGVESTSTDTHGIYSVTLAAGSYTVEATHAGYRDYRDTRVVIHGEGGEPGVTSQHYFLRLKPLDATATVEGRALELNPDGSIGAPMADVAITFSCLDTGDETSTAISTDVSGRYSIVLAQGNYFATADHPGYFPLRILGLHIGATGLTQDFVMGRINSNLFDACDADFEEKVVNAPLPVLVVFHMEGCGPCGVLLSSLPELAAEYFGRLMIAKVESSFGDGFPNPQTSGRYGVTDAFPTSVLTLRGQELTRYVGCDDGYLYWLQSCIG